MKKTVLASIVLASALLGDNIGAVKEKLQQKLVNTRIDHIEVSAQFPSLYEIHAGPNVFFTNDEVSHLMIGHVFDMNGTDLTQAKIAPKIQEFQKRAMEEQAKEEARAKAKWVEAKKTIDLTKALKIGKGKHEVVVFSNTECHWCRKSEELLKGGNMTKYIFLTTNMAPQMSRPKSVHILCAKDPAKEYDKVMRGELDGKPLTSCEKGERRVDGMMEEAAKLGGFGTPLFFIDNQVVNGANPIIRDLVK